MTIRTTLALCAGLVLAGCGATSTGPVKALPPEFVDAAMDAAFAETIAQECGSIRYNTAVEDKVFQTYAVRLSAAGYTRRDLRAGAARMEKDPALYRQAVRMIEERKINVDSEASWCAAGRREMARGTSIGRYLM